MQSTFEYIFGKPCCSKKILITTNDFAKDKIFQSGIKIYLYFDYKILSQNMFYLKKFLKVKNYYNKIRNKK